MGAYLPVKSKDFKKLEGQPLKGLCKEWEHVRLVFVDEYSLVSQSTLSHLDQRLKELKRNRRPFGGLVVILCGDTAQTQPVGGDPLWSNRTGRHNESLAGGKLYASFDSVVLLHENKRLLKDPGAQRFNEYLLQLADGMCTREDFEYLKGFSRESMGPEEWRRRGFDDDLNTTHLFPTNAEVNKHNNQCLKQLRASVVKCQAEETGESATGTKMGRALPNDEFRNLRPVIYLAKGAKVLVTWNIWPEAGLANGATGEVMDIDYGDADGADGAADDHPPARPPALPKVVWVKFPRYTGPSFFKEDTNNDNRECWVPITPQSADSYVHVPQPNGQKRIKTVTRKQIPLLLAWAWTIHKSQGQTMLNKVVLHFGTNEMCAGLSYVGSSRQRLPLDFGIMGGITFERISDMIKYQDAPGVETKRE